MNNNKYVYSHKTLIFAIPLVFILLAGCLAEARLNSVSGGGDADFIIAISEPLDYTKYPAYQQILISSEIAATNPIITIELWVNGELNQSFNPSTAVTSLYHNWQWTPQSVGLHTLLIRAIDLLGGSQVSNIVHLTSIKPTGYEFLLESDGVLSAEDIADESLVLSEDIILANPDIELAGNVPIASGQQISVPINPWADFEQPNGAAAETSVEIPSGTIAIESISPPSFIQSSLQVLEGLFTSEIPSAPVLDAGISSCLTTLLITDSSKVESGFFVYRLHPQSGSFVRIATLPERELSGTMMYEFDGIPGNHQYYIAAFNANGEAASNIVQVTTPTTCASTNQIASVAGLVNIDLGSYDEVYFYYSVNGGEWSRYPENNYAFLYPDELVDLGVFASGSGLDANIILGEAWGWLDGDLQFLGSFGQDKILPPDYASSLSPSAGLLAATTLEVRNQFFESVGEDEGTTNAPISLCDSTSIQNFGEDICQGRSWDTFQVFSELKETTFRWMPGMDVNMGIWQVSLNPFPENNQLDPPGIVLTGKTFGLGFGGLTSGQEGVFTIDLNQVNTDKLLDASKPQGIDDTQQIFEPYVPPWRTGFTIGDGPDQSLQVFIPEIPDFNNIVFGEGLRKIYVRIIPMKNEIPAGLPSNTTTIYWDPNKIFPEDNQVDFQVDILNFKHMHIPESALEYCVQVIAINKEEIKNNIMEHDFLNQETPEAYEYNANSVAQFYEPFLKSGDPLCPTKYEPETMNFWDYLGDAFGKIAFAYDIFADAYNYVSAKIDEWGAKLNPLCIQGQFIEELVDEDGNKVEDACKKGTKIAKTAALASVGLPPSMPSYEELRDQQIDYAIDLAAEEVGVECDEDCKKLIKDTVGDILDDMINDQPTLACMDENEAHALGIEPMCKPVGIDWIPHPGGQYAPAVARVRVTRPVSLAEGVYPTAEDAQACQLQVNLIPLENSYWIGKTLARPATISGKVNTDGSWEGQLISGQTVATLHEFQTIPLPLLNEGESKEIPVFIYRSKYEYKLPGTQFLNLGKDYWIQYQGMTYKLVASCGEYTDEMSYPELPVSIVPYISKQWNEVPK